MKDMMKYKDYYGSVRYSDDDRIPKEAYKVNRTNRVASVPTSLQKL